MTHATVACMAHQQLIWLQVQLYEYVPVMHLCNGNASRSAAKFKWKAQDTRLLTFLGDILDLIDVFQVPSVHELVRLTSEL